MQRKQTITTYLIMELIPLAPGVAAVTAVTITPYGCWDDTGIHLFYSPLDISISSVKHLKVEFGAELENDCVFERIVQTSIISAVTYEALREKKEIDSFSFHFP